MYGHRMLDIDVDSIMSQLKNKVSYRLKETIEGIVNDPEANQYAKEKAKSKSSMDTVEGLDKLPGDLSLDSIKGDMASATISDDMSANLSSADKMLRRIKGIALRIKDRMIHLFITFIIPLILAMFVANESIMYPAPIRIIYFIFTFVLCYVSQAAVGLLGTVYLGKFVYDYYVNKMEKRGIPLIVPPILAVLPVKVFDPSAPAAYFKDLFNFPLTYPRNERGEKNLLLIMNDYLESLKTSFTYLDNVKSMPMFIEKLKKIDENMEQLHKLIPEPVNENEKNETNQPPASLPPSIPKQPDNIPANASKQEDKKGPVPLTIAERREINGLPPMKTKKESDTLVQNSDTVSNTSSQVSNVSTSVAAPQKETNTSAPPNYNGKEPNTSSLPPVVAPQKETNTSAPPNYNGKEPNTSAPPNYNGKETNTSSLPPVIKKKEVNISAPPAYNSVPNKGNQSQLNTPKK